MTIKFDDLLSQINIVYKQKDNFTWPCQQYMLDNRQYSLHFHNVNYQSNALINCNANRH